jgi:hypothetical protein
LAKAKMNCLFPDEANWYLVLMANQKKVMQQLVPANL